MESLLLGAFLIGILLLVHYSTHREPLSADAPLDVDTGLQLPSIGHASTLFSLTGLFGIYLGLYLTLGIPVVIGLASGGITALLLMRHILVKSQLLSYESLLVRWQQVKPGHLNAIFVNLLVAAQLGIAASELAILRDLALRGFNLAPRHATALALGVALIAYMYCLRGGYGAVFRTDIVELIFLLIMLTVVAVFGFSHSEQVRELLSAAPRIPLPTWPTDTLGVPLLRSLTELICGFILGNGFLLASPDAWKRTFLATGTPSAKGRDFLLLTLAGVFPFLILLPLGLIAPIHSASAPDPLSALVYLASNDFVLAALLVGLVSCFLSSFDSALLSASHIALLKWQERSGEKKNTLQHYQIVLALAFIFVCSAGSGAVAAFGNSYFLANLVMGIYAILAGAIVGTQGFHRPLEKPWGAWAALGLLCSWFVYILSVPGITQKPTLEQLQTVPIGVILSLAALVLSYFSSSRR